MTKNLTKTPKHQPLDDETAAALTLFNTYLVADREQQAHERAIRKAEKAKDDAAATVRELNDRKASAAESAEAETAYRDAVEALRRLRDGDQAAAQDDSNEAEDVAGEVDAEAVDEQADPATEQEAPQAEAEAEQPTEAADDADQTAETEDGAPVSQDQPESVGVEASVGDDDLTGDEPAGVAG